MNSKQAGERIRKLRELINDYRYHYHVLDESIMTEAVADSLKHELTELETQFPDLITPDSPSQRVAGVPLSAFEAVAHSQRMLSLNDVFNEQEFEAWVTRVTKLLPAGKKLEYFMDLKMDGFACALVYQDGLLAQAITRGDGTMGEDVTSNVRTIETVPLRLRPHKDAEKFSTGRTEIRGEIVMYKKDFDELNQAREVKGLPLFANPRNTAAGTIRQLDANLVAQRKLNFRAYDLLRKDPNEIPTNSFAYKTLRNLGMLANPQAKTVKTVAEILAYAHEWETKRSGLKFNTDGLVIKINDRELFARFGVVGKAPRGAVAYKYPAEQATTKVVDIFISIGRTGSATPVAMLEPVLIAGSTVQMATLHNESEVLRKDVRVGDTVIVHKAGDIIPEIIEPLLKLRDGTELPFRMPTHCPECKTVLAKLQSKDAVWRCPNEACPSRTWKRIEHFASKGALDIEGLGEKNVIAVIKAGLINDTADIYSLTTEQLLKIDRFAAVSAAKLVRAIQSKKNPPLAKFLYGLGIRHIGIQTAIDLAKSFKRLDSLGTVTYQQLKEVEGIGEVVAESILLWFDDQDNKNLLAKFRRLGVWPEEAQTITGKLSGKKFVVTGSLHSMSREQAAEKIRARGGAFQSSLGKDTDYLVVGESAGQRSGASKLAKAAKIGTKQIDEDALIKLLA